MFNSVNRAVCLVPILALVWAGVCAARPEATGDNSKSYFDRVHGIAARSTFDPALQKAFSTDITDVMEKYDVPGAVVGVHIAGQGDYEATAGVGNIQTGQTLTTDMSWPLRSVTKSFVVTDMLLQVQAGNLHLDDTIKRWVPNLPNADTVTIGELANMTSGLPEYANKAFIDAYSADPERQFTPDDLIGFAATEPAQFPPGTKHVYTNTNTVVLGKIIESVTGKPLSEALQDDVLEPLNLAHTTYATSNADWPQPHATGYAPNGKILAAQPNNFSIFAGSGAMVSTLDDLQAYAPALANGTLLDPRLQAMRLEGAPLDQGPEYDQYGMGIGEIADWWGHTGEGFGFTSAVMGQVGTDNSIAIFMNLSNVGDHPPTKLIRKIVATLGTRPVTAVPEPPNASLFLIGAFLILIFRFNGLYKKNRSE
jgi:D-alanyl-D-alanine carboxypeptidase